MMGSWGISVSPSKLNDRNAHQVPQRFTSQIHQTEIPPPTCTTMELIQVSELAHEHKTVFAARRIKFDNMEHDAQVQILSSETVELGIPMEESRRPSEPVSGNVDPPASSSSSSCPPLSQSDSPVEELSVELGGGVRRGG